MRSLPETVAEVLGDEVVRAATVSGGDTASSFRFDLASGRTVFAKTHAAPPPGFFTTEAVNLRWLAEPGAVAVPEVLAASDGDSDGGDDGAGNDGDDRGDAAAVGGRDGHPPHLVLEWIDQGSHAARTDTTAADLGRSLAALHRAAPDVFGRTDGRTTGSRGLPNDPCATWAEFYATQRIVPLARLARDGNALPTSVIAALERLDADRLAEVGGPPEPPARLHGDLWAGNRLVDRAGTSWLIDPAAHGGHREFDLAMMRLFGGFGSACFDAYDEAWPLADGWPDRIALHQIAPLVIHAVKFGASYVPSATEAITTYA